MVFSIDENQNLKEFKEQSKRDESKQGRKVCGDGQGTWRWEDWGRGSRNDESALCVGTNSPG